MVFHNGSNYANHFKRQFNCLEQNNEKYITSLVLIEKEVKRIDNNRKQITKTISFRLQFIDSTRFLASSLSNLVNNLGKGIHKIKCKYEYDNKNCETCGIKYKYYECYCKHTNMKDVLIL